MLTLSSLVILILALWSCSGFLIIFSFDPMMCLVMSGSVSMCLVSVVILVFVWVGSWLFLRGGLSVRLDGVAGALLLLSFLGWAFLSLQFVLQYVLASFEQMNVILWVYYEVN